jgi:hypothetical protein
VTTAILSPQARADEAAAIRRRVMESPWPQSDEAQASIGWALGYLAEAEAERAAVLSGEIEPLRLGDPDAAWWDDPDAAADELTADRVLDAARELEKRLAEYQKRGELAAAIVAGEGEK